MKRLEIVKRAKLAGLRGDLPSAFLTQELAALAEAAGPLFKHLPEDLLRTPSRHLATSSPWLKHANTCE